jgi:hypothetical protein
MSERIAALRRRAYFAFVLEHHIAVEIFDDSLTQVVRPETYAESCCFGIPTMLFKRNDVVRRLGRHIGIVVHERNYTLTRTALVVKRPVVRSARDSAPASSGRGRRPFDSFS